MYYVNTSSENQFDRTSASENKHFCKYTVGYTGKHLHRSDISSFYKLSDYFWESPFPFRWEKFSGGSMGPRQLVTIICYSANYDGVSCYFLLRLFLNY